LDVHHLGTIRVDVIQNENCYTCTNVSDKLDEPVCEVFNISRDMYEQSTMKYGCESYIKDVKKMITLPKEYQFESKKYILWDTQYSESNAQTSCTIIRDRVPKSDPHILKLQEDNKEPVFGVYVKKVMADA
jgi:hypothetical protein